ncbi:energy transducer TonB [Mucilaginibacter sp.]|jgi:hypothetical protein|uniref:energy transducer TonB n=1 Tax=Mucilaginibacter sp. TaxID=1882438 RepID=UPI002B7FCD6B|nr:energy transducer TonB [Mucilaginibacter sp.]HTI59222.1 energy transducer TonB [Mucilaginibacter sp.]
MKAPVLIWLIALFPFKVFCQSTISADTVIYGTVQTNYPGGQESYNKYLDKNGRYPQIARQVGVQGNVLARFIIEKDSTLSHIGIYSGIGSGTDDEVIRLIRNSGKWIPSQLNGINVRTRCIVPIQFLLESDDNHKLQSGIYGESGDPDYLSASIKIESRGIPVSEAKDYLNQSVRFIGKIHATKAVADSVFVITCEDITNTSAMKFINVILLGKDVLEKDIPTKQLPHCLITGMGSVVSIDNIPVIIITDRKQYRILPKSDIPLPKGIHEIGY